MTSFLTRQTQSFSHNSSFNPNRRRIKHYSFSTLDRIGKGFSSIVYKGTNDNTNETIAIKAIDMKGVRDTVSREMLDCQIQALTKLKHPNILKCFDVVRETSHCYIITEFCNQGDLSSLLKKKRRMTQNQVLAIMKNIVDGFLEMGQNKFLHRDLKLANIFVNNGVAKIADFGFAKKSHSSFEKQKCNVGSPLYMSPQALKKNIYSIKNDIWSVGIMIYELLHGQTPWKCQTQSELIDKMTKIPVKFKQSITISQDIKNFIQKCLQVDESKRMGLSDMRIWSQKNSDQTASKCSNLGEKKESLVLIKNEIKPLGDATNRLSLGMQKNRSYSNVGQKIIPDLRSNNSFAYKDKENNERYQQKRKLPKYIIDQNNAILLIQINKFRLNYKIYQKLKIFCSEEKQLLNSLGNNILRKVETIFTILLDSDLSKAKELGEQLGLKELDLYLKQDNNIGIKKYKSVIKQYQKKYTSQIEQTHSNNPNTTQLFKDFVHNKLRKEVSKEQIGVIYWMIEVLNMRPSIRKEDLDLIIEAKNIPTKQILMKRIKE